VRRQRRLARPSPSALVRPSRQEATDGLASSIASALATAGDGGPPPWLGIAFAAPIAELYYGLIAAGYEHAWARKRPGAPKTTAAVCAAIGEVEGVDTPAPLKQTLAGTCGCDRRQGSSHLV